MIATATETLSIAREKLGCSEEERRSAATELISRKLTYRSTSTGLWESE
jgi:hypothetical protein